jgi:2-iminobutanoate/2-iminopropanoate deaminase
MTMHKPVQVPDAPRAIGPYSQAQVIDLAEHRLVWTAGQIGLDPASGELVSGGVGAQTERALRNLAAVLAGAGLGLGHVVKTTVFLADMADFTAMNEVYGRHFTAAPPARSTVAAAGLPKGARVEIEVVAIGPRG